MTKISLTGLMREENEKWVRIQRNIFIPNFRHFKDDPIKCVPAAIRFLNECSAQRNMGFLDFLGCDKRSIPRQEIIEKNVNAVFESCKNKELLQNLLESYVAIARRVIEDAPKEDMNQRLDALTVFSQNIFSMNIEQETAKLLQNKVEDIAKIFCSSKINYSEYLSILTDALSLDKERNIKVVDFVPPFGKYVARHSFPRTRHINGFLELSSHFTDEDLREDEIQSFRLGFGLAFPSSKKTLSLFKKRDEDVCGIYCGTYFSFTKFLLGKVKNLFGREKTTIANSFAEYLILHLKLNYVQGKEREKIEKRITSFEKDFDFSGFDTLEYKIKETIEGKESEKTVFGSISDYLMSKPYGDGRKTKVDELFYQMFDKKENVDFADSLNLLRKRIEDNLKNRKNKTFEDLSEIVDSFLGRICYLALGHEKALCFKEKYPYKEFGRWLQHLLILNEPLECDSVVVRTSTGCLLEDLTESRSGRCTTGNGRFRKVAYDYFADNKIDLLEIFALKNRSRISYMGFGETKMSQPIKAPLETKIGDVVIVKAKEPSWDNSVWVVETIEANYLDMLRLNSSIHKSDWREFLYYSIMKSAKDSGIKEVVFNVSVDHKPVINEFLFYVADKKNINYVNTAKRLGEMRVDAFIADLRELKNAPVSSITARRFQLNYSDEELKNLFTIELHKTPSFAQESFSYDNVITYLSAWKTTPKDYGGFVCDESNPCFNNGIGYVKGIIVNVNDEWELLKKSNIKKYVL